MKSLHALKHDLASTSNQLDLLEEGVRDRLGLPMFQQKMEQADLFPLLATGVEILQINVGKMCNQVCKHCHVDAGPDRKEIMTRETMEQCLAALANSDIPTVDLTGGAPEMNPHFRWFVEECHKLGKHVIVRCNLTIIVANPKYHDLPVFYRDHGVEVVSSLPFYNADKTDRQRGTGVFKDSIKALKMLNEVGYGKEGTGLTLNLVYNPAGAFLPGSQEGLKRQFKRVLKDEFDIEFNDLFAITNIPVSRYLDYLFSSGNFDAYMEKLVNAFNPVAARGVMCRNTISVSWDGYLFDCDFNQMLELPLEERMPQHISLFNAEALNNRNIVLHQHCYGCTAGAGSSCGGTTA
ncbi:arsenosugar biosynthesis radical SAM (seleno)protein ArsS [Telluribacter sp.]|jgi:radical SAM/Cys-rich protein|uniref:arsenosugar biosynthesis radical SAM (seleno)protein ArsS n=1 Tax=Telluribacter sp. TaxID=1978767 RepID=UPI002E15EF86|nr:arsenosugar biosynthesis radical SAM (seleno)protein ArsS [Telluribacter sp.]HEV7351348.1 arsenosugar biosynthesis radical SAM (seleno)protein ArsS [Telluribacter sp.]